MYKAILLDSFNTNGRKDAFAKTLVGNGWEYEDCTNNTNVDWANSILFIAHGTDIESTYHFAEKDFFSIGHPADKLLIRFIGESNAAAEFFTPSNTRQWKIGEYRLDINLLRFLRKYNKEEVWKIDVINGIDHCFEAVIELLQIFLPLDIELQLGDIKELGKRVNELTEDRRLFKIREYVKTIIGADIIIENLKIIEENNMAKFNEDGLASLKYLRNLLQHVSNIKDVIPKGGSELTGEQESTTKRQLDDIFGFIDKNGEKLLEPEVGTGFHRTYEKLRNNLLAYIRDE